MRRMVIKIGTNALTDAHGRLDTERVKSFARDIAEIRQAGGEVVVVSSGAVSQGQARITSNARLHKRAYAAVGQAELIAQYVATFQAHDLATGQLLLSQRDFANKDIYQVFQQTMEELLSAGVVPILNENDALTNDTAATFYDNDSLAAAVALAVNAEMLLILSHIDGLYTQDPKNSDSQLIATVEDVNKELIRLCEKTISDRGSGGMIAKVKAARLACAFGIAVVIVNGALGSVIKKVWSGASVGTRFIPRVNPPALRNRSRWIVSAKISSGSLLVDAGAARALSAGKSLLAVGVKKVYGGFKKGEIIEVLDAAEEALAVGIVSIDDQTLREKIERGEQHNQEVIHADNLILINHYV